MYILKDHPVLIKQYCFFDSVNDGSAIRVAAQWYQNHLGGAVRVLLITNDRDNKNKAVTDGIPAETGKCILLELFVLTLLYLYCSCIT